MARWGLTYLLTFAVFLALDFCWLTFTSARLYAPLLGDLMAPQFRAVPAVLFYLIYIAGLTWFAVRAGIAGGPRAGALNGAMFGLACYGTYDLTNQATLVHWSSQITVLDLIWGTSASALAAALASEMAGRWLMPELRKS